MSRTIGSTALYVNSANATGGAETEAPTMWTEAACGAKSAEKSAPVKGGLASTDIMVLVRLAKPLKPFLRPPVTWLSMLFLPFSSSADSSLRRPISAPCSRYFSAPVSKTLTHRAAPKRVSTCEASPTTSSPIRKLRSVAAVSGRPRRSTDGMEDGKIRRVNHATASQNAWLAA